MNRSVVEEDYGMKSPEYWRVSLPSDDLDHVMWGSSGVPPPAPPTFVSPKHKTDTNGNFSTTNIENIQSEVQDNILSALEISGSNEQIPTPAPEKILLEDIVWKQRSGFGRYSLGFLHHEWEQRRVVLLESGILKYYALDKEVKYDPQNATNPSRSPWVYTTNQEPRGQIDLKDRTSKANDLNDNISGSSSITHSSSFEEGIRRLGSFVPGKERALNVGGVTVQARESNGPTPFEIEITRNDNNQMWRFCFECQAVQFEWLSMLNSMAGGGVAIDDTAEVTEGLGDHGFQPGDHIIRWEILPVLYPIQIHGIVLEAGKNCVIIADFGLASYNNHDHHGLTTHLGDEAKDDKHDAIMAAWEKIKPKQKKRLNVLVVTDPKDIRKWSKIKYGGQVEKDKKSKFFSLLPRRSKHNAKQGDDAIIELSESTEETLPPEELSLPTNAEAPEAEGVGASSHDTNKDYDTEQPCDDQADYVEGEPDWIRPGFRPRKRTGSSSAPIPLNKEGQSVFSIDQPEQQPSRELPKSDSVKLVLSRTHFVLEHEELLPPYHVFYSNSECIAVWCKTGRWSTLQAAVYLVSSSFGFGKSATMLTLTVAAAHAVLLPAMAVGGLAVVGAPLLFLKKSQEKWDETTMDLTEKFWMQAEPDVYIEAIECWSGLVTSQSVCAKHSRNE